MAHPPRLSELLSGWNVDPHQASAAQAKAAQELASSLRKLQNELYGFARRLSEAAPSSAMHSHWLLGLMSAMLARSQQRPPRQADREIDASPPGAHSLQQVSQEFVAKRQSSMGELNLRDPIQRSALSQFFEFRPAIEGTAQRQVESLGLGELFKPLTDVINASRNQEQTVKAKIELDETLTIKLEKDESKIGKIVEDAIAKFLKDREKATEDAAKDAVTKADREARAQTAQERRTRGT